MDYQCAFLGHFLLFSFPGLFGVIDVIPFIYLLLAHLLSNNNNTEKNFRVSLS